MTARKKAPRIGVEVKEHKNYHEYRIDGERVVGVTTALKGIPKEGVLVGWAAKLVATHVADNIGEVAKMLESGGKWPTVDFLKALPNQRRDDAAIRGTEVHKLAERYIQGEEVEVPEHLQSYVNGYVRFIEDFNPTSIHEELVVASRTHGYAGRLDSIQDIPGLGRCLVDYKTSNGIYGQTALQVAAYRYAEVYLDGFDADGNAIEHPMIEVEKTYVLHIQPDEYTLLPLAADVVAFGKFLVAKQNYVDNVQSNKLDKLIGVAVSPPERAA